MLFFQQSHGMLSVWSKLNFGYGIPVKLSLPAQVLLIRPSRAFKCVEGLIVILKYMTTLLAVVPAGLSG
ncbi:hypothetical protein PATA110616_10970 [Paenibacillus tarimensis]